MKTEYDLPVEGKTTIRKIPFWRLRMFLKSLIPLTYRAWVREGKTEVFCVYKRWLNWVWEIDRVIYTETFLQTSRVIHVDEFDSRDFTKDWELERTKK